jgi:quercetin dioxygenase-like cupin family protein
MEHKYIKPLYIKHKFDVFLNISEVATIHYLEIHKNYQYDGETHDFWEMVYVDSGEVQVIANNKKITLVNGDVIFHEPNEYHNILANGISSPCVFVITFVELAVLLINWISSTSVLTLS